MKSLRIVALLAALNTGAWIMPQEASAQQASVSFQVFYDELSPFGTWVDYPNYGYVWIPDADPGFSPYATGGHWVFTDDGWTWVSDYPWGWATFHYGRWDNDDVYGWFWVPDNEWGPAWVSWRSSPGYYGWAPLRPGISVSIAFGRDYHERNERWIFVRDGDITRPDVSGHYVDRSNNVTIINNSTVIVNTRNDSKRNATYIAGPDRNDVQRVTHAEVTSVAIRDNDRPGQRLNNGELQIYRPQVQRTSGNGRNPAPSKVMKLNDVRPASERNAGNRQQQVRTVNPPDKGQPQQAQDVKLPDKGRPQQAQDVKPPNKGQPQKAQVENPPNKGQPQQARVKRSSNNRGKVKQPQTVKTPNQNRKVQPSQPKTNQDEKEKKKRE